MVQLCPIRVPVPSSQFRFHDTCITIVKCQWRHAKLILILCMIVALWKRHSCVNNKRGVNEFLLAMHYVFHFAGIAIWKRIWPIKMGCGGQSIRMPLRRSAQRSQELIHRSNRDCRFGWPERESEPGPWAACTRQPAPPSTVFWLFRLFLAFLHHFLNPITIRSISSASETHFL